MTYIVLTYKETMVPRQFLQILTSNELKSNVEVQKRIKFTKIIQTKLGDSIKVISVPDKSKPDSYLENDDIHHFDSREQDDNQPMDWLDRSL